MSQHRVGRARGSVRPAVPKSGTPRLEFSFGAAFTPVRTIPLQAPAGRRLIISDLLPTASGRFWIAEARAAELHIYSQQGRPLAQLGRERTGLVRPVSLTSVHGRWVALLDGHSPRIALLDDAARVVRRFSIPQVERPLQLCNIDDRLLAAVGPGWGAGAGKLIHLYSLTGDYVESLLGAPRYRLERGRPYAAAAGGALYFAHSGADSFSIYEVQARAFTSFTSLTARIARRLGPEARFAGRLSDLFATDCGATVALHSGGARVIDYLYDVYAADGRPIALGLPTAERLIAVEGPFFFSLRARSNGGAWLRIWRLELNGQASSLRKVFQR